MGQPPKQHQQDDALLHHLTGRDRLRHLTNSTRAMLASLTNTVNYPNQAPIIPHTGFARDSTMPLDIIANKYLNICALHKFHLSIPELSMIVACVMITQLPLKAEVRRYAGLRGRTVIITTESSRGPIVRWMPLPRRKGSRRLAYGCFQQPVEQPLKEVTELSVNRISGQDSLYEFRQDLPGIYKVS